MGEDFDPVAAVALAEMRQEADSARADVHHELRVGLMREAPDLAALVTRGWGDDLAALAASLNWEPSGRLAAEPVFVDRWALAHASGLGGLVGGAPVPCQG